MAIAQTAFRIGRNAFSIIGVLLVLLISWRVWANSGGGRLPGKPQFWAEIMVPYNDNGLREDLTVGVFPTLKAAKEWRAARIYYGTTTYWESTDQSRNSWKVE